MIALDLAGVRVSRRGGLFLRQGRRAARCWRRWASARWPARASASRCPGMAPAGCGGAFPRRLGRPCAPGSRSRGLSGQPGRAMTHRTARSISTTTPPRRSTRACWRPCCPGGREVRQPAQHRARHGPRGRGGGGGGAGRGRRADRRRAAGDRVHLRRHRIEQPGDQGRRALRRRPGQRQAAHRHPGDRAQMRAGKRSATWPPRASSRWSCRSRPDGLVDLGAARAARSRRAPLLVSVMAVNNEIGVVQDLAEIGALAKAAGRAVPHRCGAGARPDPAGRRRMSRSTCCRCPATRSTGRRASARSMSGAGRGCGWSRCSPAAGRNAACAPAPCRRR